MNEYACHELGNFLERQFDKINVIITVCRYRSWAKVDAVIPAETMPFIYSWHV
jgi:hypothetical protein